MDTPWPCFIGKWPSKSEVLEGPWPEVGEKQSLASEW